MSMADFDGMKLKELEDLIHQPDHPRYCSGEGNRGVHTWDRVGLPPDPITLSCHGCGLTWEYEVTTYIATSAKEKLAMAARMGKQDWLSFKERGVANAQTAGSWLMQDNVTEEEEYELIQALNAHVLIVSRIEAACIQRRVK